MIRNLFILFLIFALSAPCFGADPQSNKGSSSVKDVLGGKSEEKAPIFIKSATLSANSVERIFTYSGNVELRQADLLITANKLIGKYNEKNEIQTVVCEGNVVITRGETLRASSNLAVYNVAKSLIELTEGPELYDRGNALTADKVKIFVDEDRSEAEGQVQVKVVESASPDGAGPAKANAGLGSLLKKDETDVATETTKAKGK